MELKIESGVPIPRTRGGQLRGSVFFEGDNESRKFYSRAEYISRGTGWMPSRRTVEGGYRVWKVKRDPKPNGHSE